MKNDSEIIVKEFEKVDTNYQRCPICREKMGIMPGSRDATCHNCGFKDPCCE